MQSFLPKEEEQAFWAGVIWEQGRFVDLLHEVAAHMEKKR